MNEITTELKKIKETFRTSKIPLEIEQKVNNIHSKTKLLESELLEMQQNIALKERKKVMHKTGILKNKIMSEKNNERYISENNKQLENCQEQVKLEGLIYDMENEIRQLKATIDECNERISGVKACLPGKIILELFKGLGVEYNEIEECFVVRNVTKDQIRTFKADERDLKDKIWNFLDNEKQV